MLSMPVIYVILTSLVLWDVCCVSCVVMCCVVLCCVVLCCVVLCYVVEVKCYYYSLIGNNASVNCHFQLLAG